MRWVSSSFSDVISFYSLSDGVQHVLPSLYRGDAVRKCAAPGSSDNAGDASSSAGLRHHQRQQPENAQGGCRPAPRSNAACERKCRQPGMAGRNSATWSDSNESSSTCSCVQAPLYFTSTGGETPVRGVCIRCRDSFDGAVFRQHSLGYVTTCVFSGGWGGYDETEVTVGTTEGYVYALPALWPPSDAVPCTDTDQKGGRDRVSACRSCYSATGVVDGGITVSKGGSATSLHISCAAVTGRAGAADRAARGEETEETSSLPFPTSYVATPVKRCLRLPYTVQHLQMLGAHTPALAGDYHNELLWLQQHHHRERTSTARYKHGASDVNVSESQKCGFTSRRSRPGCEVCGLPTCVRCVSCCCMSRPLLSTYSEQFCASYSAPCRVSSGGICGTSSSARTPAPEARPASADRGQSSGQYASRVQEFFSSDRLLLALDKGGNGVVAHWPAPPYLQDSLSSTGASVSSSSRCISPQGTADATDAVPASEDEHASDAAALAASAPLAASFSLNLSVQCCASNPVATPLLAVVPSVVAAGGLRLLSVFDLVTTSFVFYARPPLTAGARLARGGAEQQEQPRPRQWGRQPHNGSEQYACAEEARLHRSSRGILRDRVWSNVCCLSSSSSVPVPLRQAAGASAARVSTSCASATSARGLSIAPAATTAMNMPISVSSLTWLPALHPLLLAASTNRGLLLLYDLRASPHPVFCAARPPSTRSAGSAAVYAGGKGAPAQKTGIPHGCTDATRKPCQTKQAASAATLPDKRSTAPEAASTTGTLSGAGNSGCAPTAGPSEVAGKYLLEGQMTDSSIRRGSSLGVGTSGTEAKLPCTKKGGTRRVCPSSSQCSEGKRRRTLPEGGQHSAEEDEEEPMSISFLATPAWLTSAATSHDAAILPCGCRCCRVRAGAFQNTGSSVCALSATGAPPVHPVTPSHHQLGRHGPFARTSGTNSCSVCVGRSPSNHGLLEDEKCHQARGCVRITNNTAPADEEDRGVKVVEELSLFGGCSASVVLKPRNSSRPRPQHCKVDGVKRGCLSHVSRRGRTATVRRGRAGPVEMPSYLLDNPRECPDGASYCEGCSLSGDAVSAAAHAQTCAVCEYVGRKTRTSRKTRDRSWRDRWFAKQERALINFFSETHRALLSKRLRRNEAAVSTPMDREVFTPMQAGDPPSCTNSSHRCLVRSFVNCATEPVMLSRRSAVRSGTVAKGLQKKGFPVADSEPAVSFGRSQALLFPSKIGARTMNADVCQAATVDCASSADGSSLSRSCGWPGPSTPGELPFYLLRLASSPCSVLSGFPSPPWSIKQVTPSLSPCPVRELPLCFSGISTAFLASCFFSLFARLLYAHRVDQHATVRRLSHHQHRQLLKLLHADDCRGSASLSQGASAVGSVISAMAAAESTMAEACSAAVAAQAAGVEVSTRACATAADSETVEQDAAEKSGTFARPSFAQVQAIRGSLQCPAGTAKPSSSPAGKLAACQGMLRSIPACSSSRRSLTSAIWTPEVSEAFCTPETATLLLDFERKLLSLYADVLLVSGRRRSIPHTAHSGDSSTTSTMLFVRDTIEEILPDLFSRHAQNCMHLLRYAADALYAFGDRTPVLTQKSAAVGKAVQAATACAAGLESEQCLPSAPSSAAISPARFSVENHITQQNSADSTMAQREHETMFRWDGIAVRQASNDTQEWMENAQLRCGCGRAEAALTAKARRWLADEFITEARLSMKTCLSKGSTFSGARKGTACFALTKEKAPLCRGQRECSSAEGFADEAQVVATVHAVASSICLCELFQSASFFPVLFFNIFRRLHDRNTGIPFCIQKNCISSLPVSDVAYQKLARSQLRLVTRQLSGRRRPSATSSADRQIQRLSNDESALRCQAMCAAVEATCPASSTYSDESVCRCCLRAALPSRAAAAEQVAKSDKISCDWTRRPSKNHLRTQQLFCLDERGRVYVLVVSLRMAGHRASENGRELQDRVNPANSNFVRMRTVGRLLHEGTAVSRNDKPPGRCVRDDGSSQQGEIRAEHQSVYPTARSQSKGSEGAQTRHTACVRGGDHTQLFDPALCSPSQVAGSSRGTDRHAVTAGQEPGERPHQPLHVERASSPGCSCARKRLLWGPEKIQESVHVEEHEQGYSFSEDDSGFGRHSILQKMWKERWLRRRQRIERCAACGPIAKGASRAVPWTPENLCLSGKEKTVKSAAARETSHIDSLWGPCSVKTQQRRFGRGDGHASAVDLAISQADKKVCLGGGRVLGVTRRTRAPRKRMRRPALLNENDKSALAEQVTSTAVAARFAQINANMSLLRLFPLLPLWSSCNKSKYLWRVRRKLHKESGPRDRIHPRLVSPEALSHVNHQCPRREDSGTDPYASQHVTRDRVPQPCPACATGVSSDLKEVSDSTSSVLKGASFTQVLHTTDCQSKKEGTEGALPFASRRKNGTSTEGHSGEEDRSDCCRRVCCDLQVEEEATFEINSKTSHGHHLGSDNCRSRVVSLSIHESGGYVLAATCAPSFLLYCSSRMDALPSYELRDRLLFGCATGTIPPSRPFRLLPASSGAPFSPAQSLCPSRPDSPTVLLPGAPSGPRPPPPVLISASPILPAGAAAPFVPHALLRRHADHGVAWGVSSDGCVSTRRLARCRPGMSASLGRQSAHGDYGAGVGHLGDPGQAVFSDWLTDEEDEKELCGDASGSETGSASDS